MLQTNILLKLSVDRPIGTKKHLCRTADRCGKAPAKLNPERHRAVIPFRMSPEAKPYAVEGGEFTH